MNISIITIRERWWPREDIAFCPSCPCCFADRPRIHADFSLIPRCDNPWKDANFAFSLWASPRIFVKQSKVKNTVKYSQMTFNCGNIMAVNISWYKVVQKNKIFTVSYPKKQLIWVWDTKVWLYLTAGFSIHSNIDGFRQMILIGNNHGGKLKIFTCIFVGNQ
jgi:hypothetical protein